MLPQFTKKTMKNNRYAQEFLLLIHKKKWCLFLLIVRNSFNVMNKFCGLSLEEPCCYALIIKYTAWFFNEENKINVRFVSQQCLRHHTKKSCTIFPPDSTESHEPTSTIAESQDGKTGIQPTDIPKLSGSCKHAFVCNSAVTHPAFTLQKTFQNTKKSFPTTLSLLQM